ncbi:HGxxPAAW family protein [Streptosporangium sp. NPDC004379]|uniref:HGxxPAAW family protein n=1 Tax=Streptosporangium sp. NPDC004379 TaxID=3366189 RepID=UPI0036CB0448
MPDGAPGPPHSDHGAGHGGRASSWLAVTVLILGFAAAGIGLCRGPDWLLLWAGTAVCVIGGVLIVAFGAFRDVSVEVPREFPDARTGRAAPGPRG